MTAGQALGWPDSQAGGREQGEWSRYPSLRCLGNQDKEMVVRFTCPHPISSKSLRSLLKSSTTDDMSHQELRS